MCTASYIFEKLISDFFMSLARELPSCMLPIARTLFGHESLERVIPEVIARRLHEYFLVARGTDAQQWDLTFTLPEQSTRTRTTSPGCSFCLIRSH